MRLKKLRDELELTQEKAARLLGISKNTWIRWEKGDFNFTRQFKNKEQIATLLRAALKEEAPPWPCYRIREEAKKKFDWQIFHQHVIDCDECQFWVKYLSVFAKSQPRKRHKTHTHMSTRNAHMGSSAID